MTEAPTLTFRTTVEPAGPAVAIILTDEQVAALGSGRRPAVVVTIGGHSERLRVAPMGGCNMVGFRKEVREAFSVRAGDDVEVTVALDVAPREVELPADLAEALAGDGEARAAFEALAFTHRKEFARWVGEAKRPETRERRVLETLDMLREGRKRS